MCLLSFPPGGSFSDGNGGARPRLIDHLVRHPNIYTYNAGGCAGSIYWQQGQEAAGGQGKILFGSVDLVAPGGEIKPRLRSPWGPVQKDEGLEYSGGEFPPLIGQRWPECARTPNTYERRTFPHDHSCGMRGRGCGGRSMGSKWNKY